MLYASWLPALNRWWLLLGAVLCLQPALAFSNDHSLPDLGSSSRATFTPQTEAVLSLSFLEALYQYANLNTDPELNDYVNDIGQRLLSHVRTPRRFQFLLINDDSINAFAGPGGVIGINTGLIMSAKTEDEIAAVLAHEIQHVEQEHLSRMFEQQKQGLLPTLAGIVGALLIGSQNPQAGMAMMTGSIAYQMEQQLAFSRDHEWEADRIGIDLLASAGYDPNAMADFFETLANRYRTGSKGSELLQTHPVTDKRISDSKAKARLISRQTAKHSPLALKLAQSRLETLAQRQSTQDDPTLTCYQEKLTQWLKQAPPVTCSPSPKHLWSEMLTLQTSTQSPEAINQHWQKLRQLYPQRQSIWLRYADHLLDTQQAERLITELGKAQDQDTMTFEQWSRLAKAYHAQADETASAWALSRAYGSIGHLKLSRTQLHRAEQQNANRTSWLKTQLENQANWLENQDKLRKGLE